MISKKTFHSLRLSMLSRDRAERAPEKARRAMVFSLGTRNLDRMTDEEKQAHYAPRLAKALSDFPEDPGDVGGPGHYRLAQEDGLMLWHPTASPGKLAKLDARLTLDPPAKNSTEGILANVQCWEPAREVAHMTALMDHGWPFPPRASWEECRPRLAALFPQHLVTIESPDEDGRPCRHIHALAGELYAHLQFHHQQLTAVTLLDPKLIRAHQLPIEGGGEAEFEEDDDEDAQEEAQCFAALDPSSLESILTALDKLPPPDRVESCHPGFAAFQKTAPVDDRPAFRKRLSRGEDRGFDKWLAESDQITQETYRTHGHQVATLAEFSLLCIARKNEAAQQHRVERQRLREARKAAVAAAAPAPSAEPVAAPTALGEARVIKAVCKAVNDQLSHPPEHSLNTLHRLREDLGFTPEDLHLLRHELSLKLRIKLRTPHWEGVHTVADLVARIIEISGRPDPEPREQVPTEVMDEIFRRTSASIDTAYADAWQAFESQLATTKVPASG